MKSNIVQIEFDSTKYQFMDRKRAEGKPYRVYMMASGQSQIQCKLLSLEARKVYLQPQQIHPAAAFSYTMFPLTD